MNISDIDEEALNRSIDKFIFKVEQDLIKAETLHNDLLDVEDFDNYIQSLDTEIQKHLEELWILQDVAYHFGENITDKYSDDILYEINPFTSEFFYYRGYVFGVMHGQGSHPWVSKWSDCPGLGQEQLMFLF